MHIPKISTDQYFNGWNEIKNYKKNDATSNALAALKLFSYITCVIPAGVALYRRFVLKVQLSPQDKIIKQLVNGKLTKTNLSNAAKTKEANTALIVNIEGLRKKASEFVCFKGYEQYNDWTRAEINRVLDNPEFEKNPLAFMEKLKNERGPTLDFRPIEDSSIRFFKWHLPEMLTVNIKYLRKKAKEYQAPKEVEKYINSILDCKEFQKDTANFLMKWEIARGYSEEFRMPEDPARWFFEEHMLNKPNFYHPNPQIETLILK